MTRPQSDLGEVASLVEYAFSPCRPPEVDARERLELCVAGARGELDALAEGGALRCPVVLDPRKPAEGEERDRARVFVNLP